MNGRPVFTINFAGTNYRRLGMIAAVLYGASACLAIVLAVLLWTAVADRRAASARAAQTAELAAADEKIRPILQERERLTADLTTMSALTAARSFSWTRFFSRIEAAVPLGVALNKLDYRPGDRSTVFEGTALSPEALSKLVIGLGSSPGFSNPLLKHQSMDKGSITFHVVATYQDPAPAGARGPLQRR